MLPRHISSIRTKSYHAWSDTDRSLSESYESSSDRQNTTQNQSLMNHSKPSEMLTTDDQPYAAITVHRVAIRPSILVLKDGNVHARLRYVVQLHRKLTEQYKLIFEARINRDYPPLYVG